MTTKREVREDQHGTPTGYVYGCRCAPCVRASRQYQRGYRSANREKVNGHSAAVRDRARQAAYAEHATRDEVRQWAAGLGFTISPSMTGAKAEALIARFNREHPDRTYMRPHERTP